MGTQTPRVTVTLDQARDVLASLAHTESVLLLSEPGIGKSETVARAAQEAGLECRSLLGTQIAPEDVSGIPRLVGQRTVFCPPRVLLPEDDRPFCLFLDELPACAPDVQKAFYSLLLERRLGEYALPPGTWVVAAGNRMSDRALVRNLSSALINRVTILNVRADVDEWLEWASRAGVRPEIQAFIQFLPDALLREVPAESCPFSTPRSWTSLSRSLDLVERSGRLTPSLMRALAFGRVSASDAEVFCAIASERIANVRTARDYVMEPASLPHENTARWFALNAVRSAVAGGHLAGVAPLQVDRFLNALPLEHRSCVLLDLVDRWAALGADSAFLGLLDDLEQGAWEVQA